MTCLKSVLNSTYNNFNIVLVDNGSRNNEAKLFKTYFSDKRLSVIRLENNLGFTGGNNYVIGITKSKYVVLLNNDTIVDKYWLSFLVNKMEENPLIAVAQPKIRLMYDKNSFDYAGAAGGFIDKYGYPFTRGRMFNTLEIDNGQYNDEREIFWASGAAVIIRRKVISKVGGLFDTTFFNYMEEIDFCWRVWKKGYKVFFVPKSIVYHKVAATSKNNLFKKRFWEHRNNLILILKNSNKNEFIKILGVRIMFEIITYIYYLITGKFKYFFALLYAHIDFLRLLILNDYHNDKNTKFNIIPIFKKSIVIQYYLCRKKYFWQLDFDTINGERSSPESKYLSPTYYQHEKAYEYCAEYATNKSVLEFGCGNGYGAYKISNVAKSVLAIDRNADTIRNAKLLYKKTNLKYETQNIIKYKSNYKYDLIIMLQVIEHINNTDKLLSNITRLLKRNGKIIISTPNRLTQSYNENPYHIKEYSQLELNKLLSKYYSHINMKGLHGNIEVMLYETNRKNNIEKIMSFDKYNFRNIIPRFIKIILFNIFMRIVRTNIYKKNIDKVSKINLSNYYINNKNVDKSIDLLVIGHN